MAKAGNGSGTHHVVPSPNSGWDVRRGGAGRGSGHCDTNREAIDPGREISRNAGTEFKFHDQDGRIGQSDSHGNDSRNIKG
jgi:hypothetical protein